MIRQFLRYYMMYFNIAKLLHYLKFLVSRFVFKTLRYLCETFYKSHFLPVDVTFLIHGLIDNYNVLNC